MLGIDLGNKLGARICLGTKSSVYVTDLATVLNTCSVNDLDPPRGYPASLFQTVLLENKLLAQFKNYVMCLVLDGVDVSEEEEGDEEPLEGISEDQSSGKNSK
jgi:hypothetical protein